jgi:hypothetical protein
MSYSCYYNRYFSYTLGVFGGGLRWFCIGVQAQGFSLTLDAGCAFRRLAAGETGAYGNGQIPAR